MQVDRQRIRIYLEHRRRILGDTVYARYTSRFGENGWHQLWHWRTNLGWRWVRYTTQLLGRRKFTYACTRKMWHVPSTLHGWQSPIALMAGKEATPGWSKLHMPRHIEQKPNKRVITAYIFMLLSRFLTMLISPVKQRLFMGVKENQLWLSLRYLTGKTWQLVPSWILLASG